MEVGPLEVKIVTKVKGLWKLALLNFLMRHVSTKHIVHVHMNTSGRQECVAVVNAPVTHQGQPPATTLKP